MHQNVVRKKVCTKMLLVKKYTPNVVSKKSVHQNIILE